MCKKERGETTGCFKGGEDWWGAVVEEEVVVKPRRGTSLGFCSEDAERVPFTMQVFLRAIQMGLSLFLHCTVLLGLFLLLR